MKYHKLGSSDLLVSEVCLGTMTFGEQVSLVKQIARRMRLLKPEMACLRILSRTHGGKLHRYCRNISSTTNPRDGRAHGEVHRHLVPCASDRSLVISLRLMVLLFDLAGSLRRACLERRSSSPPKYAALMIVAGWRPIDRILPGRTRPRAWMQPTFMPRAMPVFAVCRRTISICIR